MKKEKTLHEVRLDAFSQQREAAARLELARAEFALADARCRHETSEVARRQGIAEAEERVARAKAAL